MVKTPKFSPEKSESIACVVDGRSLVWEFNIDILGPQHEKLEDRRMARKVLSRKRLKVIERAALLATKAKLPPGFRATLS